MAALNQDIQFEKLDGSVRAGFSGGVAAKRLVGAGTRLFRFSGHSNMSAWWTEANELPALLIGAKGEKKNLAQYVRERSAVLRLWNPDMYNLIVAVITQSVYGFQGKIAPQNEAARYKNSKDLTNYKKKFTKPVYFKGGGGQIYIPNLTSQHMSIIVPAGVVNIFDDIDEITDFFVSYKIV